MYGALFQNTKKQKESQPDYQGNVEIGDKKYSLAGWKKNDKNGKTYLSLKLSDFIEKNTNQNNQESNTSPEDIPF